MDSMNDRPQLRVLPGGLSDPERAELEELREVAHAAAAVLLYVEESPTTLPLKRAAAALRVALPDWDDIRRVGRR